MKANPIQPIGGKNDKKAKHPSLYTCNAAVATDWPMISSQGAPGALGNSHVKNQTCVNTMMRAQRQREHKGIHRRNGQQTTQIKIKSPKSKNALWRTRRDGNTQLTNCNHSPVGQTHQNKREGKNPLQTACQTLKPGRPTQPSFNRQTLDARLTLLLRPSRIHCTCPVRT